MIELNISGYHVIITARRDSVGVNFNKSDTMALLNDLGIYLFKAYYYYRSNSLSYLAKAALDDAEAIFNALDKEGYYK